MIQIILSNPIAAIISVFYILFAILCLIFGIIGGDLQQIIIGVILLLLSRFIVAFIFFISNFIIGLFGIAVFLVIFGIWFISWLTH